MHVGKASQSALQLVKKGWVVCHPDYVIGAHKNNVWTVGICPATGLLSALSECAYVWWQ